MITVTFSPYPNRYYFPAFFPTWQHFRDYPSGKPMSSLNLSWQQQACTLFVYKREIQYWQMPLDSFTVFHSRNGLVSVPSDLSPCRYPPPVCRLSKDYLTSLNFLEKVGRQPQWKRRNIGNIYI